MDDFSGDDMQVPLVRPFIEHRRTVRPAHEDDGEMALSGVRAYTMTGGRAHAAVHLEFETMLQTTAAGREALTAMKFERADILTLGRNEPLSVAELSAYCARYCRHFFKQTHDDSPRKAIVPFVLEMGVEPPDSAVGWLPERLRLLSEEGTRHNFLLTFSSDRYRLPGDVQVMSLGEFVRGLPKLLEG